MVLWVKLSTWWPARLGGGIQVNGIRLVEANSVGDSLGVPKSRLAAAAPRNEWVFCFGSNDAASDCFLQFALHVCVITMGPRGRNRADDFPALQRWLVANEAPSTFTL